MIQHQSHIASTLNQSGKSCDVCGNRINEGDALFVGVIETGLLVNVAHCCRNILHSVFSQSQYWHPPEIESQT